MAVSLFKDEPDRGLALCRFSEHYLTADAVDWIGRKRSFTERLIGVN